MVCDRRQHHRQWTHGPQPIREFDTGHAEGIAQRATQRPKSEQGGHDPVKTEDDIVVGLVLPESRPDLVFILKVTGQALEALPVIQPNRSSNYDRCDRGGHGFPKLVTTETVDRFLDQRPNEHGKTNHHNSKGRKADD